MTPKDTPTTDTAPTEAATAARNEPRDTHDAVRAYYGERLQSSADLQTNACCTPADIPAPLKEILGKIHPDVSARYYGCGLLAPQGLKGARILDLGCGAGRDVYALAALAGPTGAVTGVDMTPEQLAVARAHRAYHAEAFGHPEPTTTFLDGYIERLRELPFAPESFDVIVSNCVINLATDKQAVFEAAYHLLGEGGEMYFSDVYADRRIPESLQRDEVLYGECLSGALYWSDTLTMARAAGFGDPRVVEHRALTIENPELEARLGGIRFASVTLRLVRASDLEPGREDYGQTATYRGTLADAPEALAVDANVTLPVGHAVPVSGNTARLLASSRFAAHVDISAPGAHAGQMAREADPHVFAVAAPTTPAVVGSGSGCCG